MMHQFDRAHGGLGREENLVMLCSRCHRAYDQSAERGKIRAELREYLQGVYPDWNEKELIYKKGEVEKSMEVIGNIHDKEEYSWN